MRKGLKQGTEERKGEKNWSLVTEKEMEGAVVSEANIVGAGIFACETAAVHLSRKQKAK